MERYKTVEGDNDKLRKNVEKQVPPADISAEVVYYILTKEDPKGWNKLEDLYR